MNTIRPSSLLRRTSISFGLSVVIFLLGAVIESALHAHGIRGVWEWIDNATCAMVAGMVVFAYEQRQYKRMVDRLRVMAAMNHHVRNALQPILYMPHNPMAPEDQARIIRECVGRIQWALTDVLPGEFAEYHDPSWPAQPSAHVQPRAS